MIQGNREITRGDGQLPVHILKSRRACLVEVAVAAIGGGATDTLSMIYEESREESDLETGT